MKKPNAPGTPANSENTTQYDPASGPTNSELQFNQSHPLSGPRPTRQPGILHLIRNLPENTLPLTANGGDNVIRLPQKQS